MGETRLGSKIANNKVLVDIDDTWSCMDISYAKGKETDEVKELAWK